MQCVEILMAVPAVKEVLRMSPCLCTSPRKLLSIPQSPETLILPGPADQHLSSMVYNLHGWTLREQGVNTGSGRVDSCGSEPNEPGRG